MRALFVLALVALHAACGGTPRSTVTDPPQTGDPAEAVFGDTAWRMPDSVDFIGFDGTDFIVAAQHGAVVRFTRRGERTVLRDKSDDEIRVHALVGTTLIAGAEKPFTFDVRTRREQGYVVDKDIATLATNGTVTITADGDDETPLRVLDAKTGARLRVLEHSRGYTATTFAGDRVVAGRRNRAIGIWDTASGKRHRVFANGGEWAMSPDGLYLATGPFRVDNRNYIDIYRIEDGTRMAVLDAACSPALAFSPDGKHLAWACDDETRVVAVPAGTEVAKLDGIGTYVRTVAWSPASDVLAVGGNDNVLHAWDAATWKPLTRVAGSRGEIRQLGVAEPFLVTHAWGDHSAWLWSTDRVKPAIELGGRDRHVYGVATNGSVVAVAVRQRPQDKMVIERWRGASRVASKQLPEGRWGSWLLVREVGLLEDGSLWVSAEGRLFVFAGDKLDLVFSTPAITSDDDDFSADGSASATRDGRVAVLYTAHTLYAYDLVAHKQITRLPFPSCGAAAHAVAPTGKRAALVDDNGITVFDLDDDKMTASLAYPSEGAERAVAWGSADEVVAVIDNKLIAWKPGAATAHVAPVSGAISIAAERDRVYIGRNDGTVLRRSLASLRSQAKALAVKPASACEPDEGGGGFGFGNLGGEQARGRLDDNEPWDEPDPPMPSFDDGDR